MEVLKVYKLDFVQVGLLYNATTLALSCEGKDDNNPIELPEKIRPAAFNDLCTYLFFGPR